MHRVHRQRLLLALAALPLLALTAARAAPGGAAYAIGAPPDLRAAWTLSINGAWPTQCPPTLQSVSLDGADLRVDARSVLELCTRTSTPFAIEVDPAAALNRANLAPGVYHVSFYAADGAQAKPKLRAFALVDRSAANAPTVAPETGFWWTTGDNADRTVLSIELQNAQLSVALMSYDRYGQPQWYFGAAPYAGRIAHVPLLKLNGGSDLFAAASATPASGESTLALDLQFGSSAHAAAWLSRIEGDGDDATLRLRNFELARLPLAETADGSAWQGDWVLVDESGAQRLHFDKFAAPDAAHFELADSASGATLTCTRDANHPDLPPSACAMRQANTVRQFDSVAITRMDGGAVHLLRITR